jgi:AAA+ superfamily predicted ATPase
MSFFKNKDEDRIEALTKSAGARREDLMQELALLVSSRYNIIWLKTMEEERVEILLRHLADKMSLKFFVWRLNTGLRRDGYDKGIYGTGDPVAALSHVWLTDLETLSYFPGIGPYMENLSVREKLMEIARGRERRIGAVVLSGTDLIVCESLKPYIAVPEFPPAESGEFAELLHRIYRDMNRLMNVKVEMTDDELRQLLGSLKGLTIMEAEKILTKAIVEDGCLNCNDIRLVIEAKKQIIERDGLLEYFPVEESMSDIADLKNLKEWLAKRKAIITEPQRAGEFGLSFPRGILLVGVPGCGKSLCAKAVASEWRLPLLKMDPSNLYNKYIGETERNFKRAMETASKIAPVVLWIDEIEKAFASGREDDGVSQRVLGTFLSWMQDRQGDVFVVATSNDVTKLPPEFLRKGRFDEIFFVDLPDEDSRRAIFTIHLKRRGRDPKDYDLKKLASATEEFSGAEIEQAIASALYTAYSRSAELTTELVLEEAGKTVPLARMRAEQIAFLKQWAAERTVSAQ